MRRSHWLRTIRSGMLSLALALSGALMVFCAGCAPSADTGMPTIKVAYWGGPEEITIFEDLIAEWRLGHPDVRVRLEHTPFSAYVSRLLTRIAGNVAPDIMAIEVNLFPSLWAKDAFLSLQPFIDSDPTFDLDAFFPEVIGRFTVEGQVYAIPRDTAPFACVYYNKRLFDKAGIPYPSDDWDWSDLLHDAQRLTERDAQGKVSRYGFYGWAWQNFVYSNGGKLVDDLYHPRKCLLGQPEAIEGLQFYADLMNVHEVAPTPIALGNMAMGAQQLFMSQRVAIFASGFWEVPILRRITDFDWDVAMFPKGPGGKRAFGTGGTGYAILKSSKHPELAWKVLKALADESAQARLAEAGLAQPAIMSVAKGKSFALSSLPPKNKGMLNEAVKYAIYEPFLAQWREIFERHIAPELDDVFHGRRSAKEAMAVVVPRVDAALREKK